MAWTVLGAIGITFASANLRASRKDIEALKEMDGQSLAMYRVMRIVAYGHYRNDLFRLSKHSTIFFVGAVAMIIPPQNPHQPVSPLSLVITGGLLAISILLVMASALDKRQRDALEEDAHEVG